MTLPVSFKLSPTNVPHTNVHRTHASVPMLSYPYPRYPCPPTHTPNPCHPTHAPVPMLSYVAYVWKNGYAIWGKSVPIIMKFHTVKHKQRTVPLLSTSNLQ